MQLEVICEFVVPRHILSLHLLLAQFKTFGSQSFVSILRCLTSHVEFGFGTKQFLWPVRVYRILRHTLLLHVYAVGWAWTASGSRWEWTPNIGPIITCHYSSSFLYYLLADIYMSTRVCLYLCLPVLYTLPKVCLFVVGQSFFSSLSKILTVRN